MSLRHLAAVLALFALLTGCSDDEPKSESDDETPTVSDSPQPEATLPSALAQVLTPAHLDDVCPGGQFTEADDVLGTLPAAYAEQATQIFTYDCAGLRDQVVWAELPDAEVAAELLDPANSEGAPTFVAGNTVLAVAPRLVDEAGLDTEAFFADLSEQCGCGSAD